MEPGEPGESRVHRPQCSPGSGCARQYGLRTLARWLSNQMQENVDDLWHFVVDG